jgi:hypothetical protein
VRGSALTLGDLRLFFGDRHPQTKTIITIAPDLRNLVRAEGPRRSYPVWLNALKLVQKWLVLRTGFEPAIFAVKGRCPKPLDDRSDWLKD